MSRVCKYGHASSALPGGRRSNGSCVECRHNRYKRDVVKHRIAARKWYANNRGYHRSKRGLPAPTRPEPAFCECCGRVSDQALHLDHDHTTGKFRGWLCSGCNRGMGYLGDSAEGLARAQAYLRRAS